MARLEIADCKPGDHVGFKADYEQSGVVVAVESERNWMGELRYKLYLRVSHDYYDYHVRPYEHWQHGRVVEINGDYAIWRERR